MYRQNLGHFLGLTRFKNSTQPGVGQHVIVTLESRNLPHALGVLGARILDTKMFQVTHSVWGTEILLLHNILKYLIT